MPDNETNDNNDPNKRPKRRAAQRTYVSYENTSVWSEDKDLKRALLASLQDVKRNASKSNTVYEQKAKKESSIEKKINRSDVYSKLNAHNSSQTMVCKDSQPLVADNSSCSLLSLAARRRAQRKFAQSSGFSTNSPVSTPIKTGFVASNNVVELFPNQKPNTEDFLTFLCLRRSPILPPNLDFIRLNNDRKAIEEKKRETDYEINSSDELEQNNDKYMSCRIRASVDRRESASSTVSKTTSLSSRASLQISNRNKKSEIQRIDSNKSQNNIKPKRTQTMSCESGLKNVGSNSNQNNIKQSQSKKISLKINELKTKTFDSLKEKYKKQRIEKKSSNPSKSVNSIKKVDSKNICENKSKDKKKLETKGIQTRQQLRNDSHRYEMEEKVNSKSDTSERILRSHHSDVFTQCLPKISNNLLIEKTNKKKTKASAVLNSSQIGIRPKTRKAKPVVPLIDYYFDSEFESDSEKRENKSEGKKVLNVLNEMKTKNTKNNNLRENKNKKIPKLKSEEKEMRSPGRPKGSTKIANKSKTSLNSEPRRLTRSSRPLSPPKDNKDLERERLIKQQIIAIERKHKRLRRYPSDQSLHSSSSSSSSSSSESLPNSLSSSSSINNTRLTRSLEHLKKIRDIAAKLKKEQNKKEDKNKTYVKNEISRNIKKTVKCNQNERQNEMKPKKPEICIKESKVNNKTKKPIIKSKERTITRRMSESVMSATSDTDCDTEEAPEDVVSEMNGTEDSMASIMDEDMERASIVLQDMAEDINTLLVNTSETDLQYGSTEHIQGLMTHEFSGVFSEETVTTASAILLPSDCHSEYSYVNQTDDTTQTRLTVDASTNTTEDDILACLSSDETQTSAPLDSNSKTMFVGTPLFVNSSVQTDSTLD